MVEYQPHEAQRPKEGQPLYLEDIRVGMKWETPLDPEPFTEEAVHYYVKGTRDRSHGWVTDPDRELGDMGKMPIPGGLAVDRATALIFDLGHFTLGEGGSMFAQVRREIDFRTPVYLGDSLRVADEVVEVRPSSSGKPRGIVKIKRTVYNQRGEVTHEITQVNLINTRPAVE